MNKIQYLIGDATEPIGDGNKIICHVCNDIGVWGAGFVLAISNKWPNPETVYRSYKNYGGLKLNTIQIVQVKPDLHVVNMVAQSGIRKKKDKIPLRYDSLKTCLTQVASVAKELKASVHMPRIGCGLAGGSWDKVEEIINDTLCKLDISVFVYDLS